MAVGSYPFHIRYKCTKPGQGTHDKGCVVYAPTEEDAKEQVKNKVAAEGFVFIGITSCRRG